MYVIGSDRACKWTIQFSCPVCTGPAARIYGRPVDVEQASDGSLLVSDDFNGVIYRISYSE